MPPGDIAETRSDLEEIVSGIFDLDEFAVSLPSACGNLMADSNSDGNLDLRDFAEIQRCFGR